MRTITVLGAGSWGTALAVLAARDLERTVDRLRREFELGEPYRDPGVAYFGLANAVFAIGDTAAAEGGTGADLPMLSPPAMQAGRYVASVILDEARGRRRKRKPFRYLDKGTMATIGRNSAVAQVGRLRLRGFVGWAAWPTPKSYLVENQTITVQTGRGKDNNWNNINTIPNCTGGW